jgi:hypothetical protein
MTPEEIVRYYNNESLGSFSTALFELFMKADHENVFKLACIYPEYAVAFKMWCEKEPEKS